MRKPVMHIAKWSAAVALCLQLAMNARAEERPAPHAGQRIANTYGFAHWDEIVEIKYTFNVKTPERETARHWTWRPKDDTVTLEVEGEPTITYKRGELDENTSDEVMTADKRFINDSYWFLFPYQLVWSNPTITDRGDTPLPIGDGTGRKLTVQYPAEGGYTPGDAYDIYLGGDGLITHWVFRKGGGEDGRAMTWENTIDLGPIKVCTDHYNTDKSFRLWFSGLSVTTADGVTHSPPELSEQANALINEFRHWRKDRDPAEVITVWPKQENAPTGKDTMAMVKLPSREDIASDGFRFHLAVDEANDCLWILRSGGFVGGETWFGPYSASAQASN